MSKTVGNLKLISNRRLTEDYFVLDIQSETDLPEFLPGQFIQVRVDNSKDTFLRRPISVYDVDYGNRIIRLLIKSVGKGTRALACLDPGSLINIVYPMGNGFSLPSKEEKVLLVGGGVGVAPLFLLGSILSEKGVDFKYLLGYQSSKHVLEIEKYRKTGEVILSTDDGSEGFHGLVINHPVLNEGSYDRIYCCGPDPMMKGIAAIAAARGIDCEVSLENTMACGYGVCLCCVADTIKGNVNTCVDGPVFNTKFLKWQI